MKCPNCDSTNLEKITDVQHKVGLVSIQNGTNESGIHLDTVLAVDAYGCKDCGFVSLISENKVSKPN